ncbi:MAG TPA: TonB-dependent receptor [Bryobacteraceae bacterium]|nr:TonB-dependent receptor [Bryobacteraceae bacterium]
MNRVFTILIALCCLTISAPAQADRATLSGTVTDSSGAAMAGVHVELTDTATGFHRDAMTGEAGSYSIGTLGAGTYKATFSHEFFQSVQYDSLSLLVGENRTLDVELQIATTAQETHVEAEVSPIAEVGAELGGVVGTQQLEDLPLNGRNWASLMALVPGAVDTGTGTASSIRFVGHANDDNYFRLDGVDQNGVIHQYQNVNFRLQVPTEAIAEFRVNASTYGVTEGGAPAGQVEIVSKSGSNAYHGSLYEYFRNDKLDTRGPFDRSTIPPLRLNQFGASVGGAIIKNKLFFFANYEGLRQSIGQTLIGFVPSDSFRAAALLQSPQIAPLLNAYPHATIPTASPDTSELIRTASQSQQEDSGLIRFDYRLDDANTFFARYSLDAAFLDTPKGNIGDHTTTTSHPMNGAIEFLHVFSSNMFNQVEVGINRIYTLAVTNSLLYNQTGIQAALTVPGYETLNSYAPSLVVPTTGSLVDRWTKVMGKHTFQAGAEMRIVHYNRNNVAGNGLAFASRPAFAADQMNLLTLINEIPMTGQHEVQYAGYAQDQIKFLPNLTVMVGLRYDFFNRFHEIYGRDHPFDIQTCGGYCPVGSQYTFPVYDDFQPRASIAWAPKAFGGKTVIRIGSGLFAGEGTVDDLTGPNDSYGTRYVLSSAQAPGLTFPYTSFLQQAQFTAVAPRALQRKRGDGSVAEWGLQIQTELGDGFTLSTGYQGSHGYKIFARSYVNVIDPLTGQRPLPAFGQIDIKRTDGVTSFNGWQTSLQKRYHDGWLFSANYMWGHSLNDGAVGGGEADYPENVACRACEYANSDQDVRHSFTANAVYELPFGQGRKYLSGPSFARAVFGGWEWSSIFTARTGIPVNVTVDRSASAVPDGNSLSPQRPNLISGVSLIPPGGQAVNDWINIAAFPVPANGTFGNAGRNLVWGPGLWQFDTSLGKKFRLTERFSAELSASAFNVFNRAQFGLPNADISSPAFGRITTTVNSSVTGSGTPRQFQFMLRVAF